VRYGLTVDVAPAAEPVLTADAKEHLRVEITTDDDYIDTLVASARDFVEDHLQRKLITQTLDMTLDRFPPSLSFVSLHHNHHHHDHALGHDPSIYLPRSPVQSITSIKYIDDAGVEQTLAVGKFKLDTKSLVARVVPAFGEEWPTTRAEINAVTVKFVVGYGAAGADVPAAIIHAIKLLVGTFYDPVRATVIVGSATKMPDAADFLLGPFRVATRAGSY